MKSAPLHLPVFQKFDCHHCGHCCRDMVVNVTPEERAKIMEAGWAQRLPGEALFISYRFHGRKFERLAHKADGACIFLGADGLCGLHKESGIGVKPLTCRLYPFVPTPGVGGVRVDVRADCPSVAGNQGRSLVKHRREIEGLVEETDTRPMDSWPEWKSGRPLRPAEFEALTRVFGNVLSHVVVPIRHRLVAGGKMLDALGGMELGKIRDERLVEVLELLRQAAMEEAGAEDAPAALPGRTGRLFRQWLFLHAINDDPAVKGLAKYRRSWARYRQAGQFAAGVGAVPRVAPDWPATTFEAVAGVGPAEDEDLEPLCRSMQVKLDAHAFCGPGYYGQGVLTGLTALWMVPSLAGWFARLEAVKAGHKVLAKEDVVAGVSRAHRTFGVSPVFSRMSERLRLRALAVPGTVGGLLRRYGA